MKPAFYLPHPALAGYISHIMIVEEYFAVPYAFFIPFPPTPQHAIHFYPRDLPVTRRHDNTLLAMPRAVIIGPQVTHVNIAMGSNHRIISVAFQPGGLHRLLKTPLFELFDQPYDATLVLGANMAVINEQLQNTESHIAIKNILDSYFIKKLPYSDLLPWERAMKAQLAPGLGISIESAAALSCLSLRQFERRANEVMGYSPKTFSRLIRFSKAYRLKENSPKQSWTDIAYTCGYYDQMHLIRDFKDFAGALPGVITQQIQNAPVLLQEHMKI